MAKLSTASKTVAAAGTRERLVAVASNIAVHSVAITAKAANTGYVYVGADDVASTNTPGLNPGDTMTIEAAEPFNLQDVYLDVQVSTEGVDYVAIA